MATPFRLRRSSISGKRPSLSDLQLGELALNFYDGYLFAERDTGGVGIGTTIALLTPWTENYGAGSIHYLNSVAIGKENPTGSLDVFGHTELDNVNISGVATIATLGISGNVDIDGHTTLDNVSISGVTTIFNTTNNVLGDSNTGAFQIDGGLGVDKNVTVNGNLDVQGYSNFVGVVTFRGGTINLGDANTDDINIGGEFVSDLVPDATNLYSLGTLTKQWKDLYIDGTADVDALTVSGVSTFTGNIDVNGGITANTAIVEDLTENRIVIVGGGGTASQTQSGVALTSTSNNGLSLTTGTNADISMVGNSAGGPGYFGAGNENPSVSWDFNVASLPATVAVASYSVLLEDLRAVDGGGDPLVHWSVSDIPANITTIPADAVANNITGATINNNFLMALGQPVNTLGVSVVGYSGPQPPTNENHIYRLSVTAQLSGGSTGTLTQSIEFRFNTTNALTGAPVGTTVAADNLSLTHTLPGGGELEDDANLTFDGSTLAVGVGLDVDGHTELDNVNITGVSTFTSPLDINTDVDIDGHTELDNVSISGVSTFSSPLDINADVDIDGHTELDNVNIAGVTTFQSNAFFGDADYIQMGDSQDLKIGHVGSYSVILDQGEGNLSIGGDGFVDIMNTALDEYKARFTTNGSVELYFDNVNKFETTGYGATVFGTLQSQQLNVTGVSTFAGDADFNGHIDVDGHTELDNVNISGIVTTFDLDVDGQTQLDHLNVAGVSTYVGDADFNGHIDVDGHTELDNVNISGIVTTFDLDVDGHTNLDNVSVSGVTTTSGLLDINAGGKADTFIVEDLTDNRIVIAGTGGELEDDANLTFNGSTLFVGVDLDVDGHTELDNLAVSGVSTFTGAIDANGDLDVDGHTELDNVNVSGVSTFVGIGTFNSDLFVAGDLNIIGNVVYTEASATNLVISGVSTFSGQIDANGDLDVDGHTNLDNVDIAGVTTTSGLLDINAGGQANTFKVEDLTDNRVVIAGTGGELEDDANLTFNGSTLAVGVDLDVDGHTNLDNVSVAGVTTFTGAIDANGDLDVDGTTELDVLNVAETATFSANIDANGDLDVDGHTELDNVNISGVATATAFHTGAEGSAIRVTSNTISGPAEMFIDPAGVGDNTGALRIKGDLFVDGTQTVINSTTIELGDFIVGIATTATTDSLADGAGIKIGPDNTFLYDHSNTSLKSSENLNLASGKTYKIDGTDVLSATTLGSGVVNSSLTSLGTLLGLTVSGQTTLNTLGVTGVSTFTGAIDANGDLDVDGHTNLDNVSISGITTFTGGITASGSLNLSGDLDVDGHTNLDNVSVAGVTTFTGNIDANGDLDVDGHTELDNLNVTGVSTFSGNLNLTGDIVSNLTITSTDGGSSAAPEFKLFRNSASPADADYLGQIKFAGESDTGVERNYAKITGKILDASNGTEDGIIEIAHIKAGSQNISARFRSDSLQLLNGTNFSVAGDSTFTGDVDANGDLDVDGHTNLDNVSVAGVTTFAGKIVGAATDNVIPFLYSTMGDLPNAGTYHGAFAHVHNQGKGFFAHGGNWYELVNKEQNGTVGTGTERYNVGQIDATDVDVSGITTSVSLHVGVGGTVITASGIGSVGINSTTPAYALDVVGDINSSTDIKVNGVSIVSQGASLDDVVALAIALG